MKIDTHNFLIHRFSSISDIYLLIVIHYRFSSRISALVFINCAHPPGVFYSNLRSGVPYICPPRQKM